MSDDSSVGEVDQDVSVAEILADMTGRPAEDFEVEGYEYPDFDELESVKEHRIELSQYDLDHLNSGQPVFKGIGDSVRVVLYSDAPLESESDGDD